MIKLLVLVFLFGFLISFSLALLMILKVLEYQEMKEGDLLC